MTSSAGDLLRASFTCSTRPQLTGFLNFSQQSRWQHSALSMLQQGLAPIKSLISGRSSDTWEFPSSRGQWCLGTTNLLSTQHFCLTPASSNGTMPCPTTGLREAIAAGILRFHHISGTTNPADILSKHWGLSAVWDSLRPILFWKGDTAALVKTKEQDDNGWVPWTPWQPSQAHRGEWYQDDFTHEDGIHSLSGIHGKRLNNV